MTNWLSALLIIYCCYFFILLFLTNARIVTPAFIYTLSFGVAIGLALLFQEELYFNLDQKTFWLVSIAGAIMVAVELFYILLHDMSERTISDALKEKEHPIIIKKSFIDFIFVLSLIFVSLSVLSLFLNTNSGSFSQRMYTYKIQLVKNAGSLKLHFITAQLLKILTAIVYVVTYIWIFNFSKARIRGLVGVKEVIIILCFMIGSFITQGARQPAIEYVLYFIFVCISLNLKGKEKRKIFKIVIRAIPIILLLGAAYYYTMVLAGRTRTPRKLLEYISANYSGGLYYLDSIIDKPATSKYFGQNSFNLIYRFLSKIGLVRSSAYIAIHPFGRYGNTLTILGRWYEDFGDIGVYIMTFLVAIFFCHMFYSKVGKRSFHQHTYRVFYCKFLMIMTWAGYDDGIRGYLSIGGVFSLLLIYLFCKILIEKNMRIKIGTIKFN